MPRTIEQGAVSVLMLMLLVVSVAAQRPKLSNVDLCNGMDRSSARPQIFGCTALLKSDISNPQVLAIAHNNRGNAFASIGQYELAIQDYTASVKLDPKNAKALNNRGAAYQKKGA